MGNEWARLTAAIDAVIVGPAEFATVPAVGRIDSDKLPFLNRGAPFIAVLSKKIALYLDAGIATAARHAYPQNHAK